MTAPCRLPLDDLQTDALEACRRTAHTEVRSDPNRLEQVGHFSGRRGGAR